MNHIEELKNLVESVDIPEKERMLYLIKQIEDSQVRRRRILAIVQEALQQLRLDMKYLVFDLEATRRERDALKG